MTTQQIEAEDKAEKKPVLGTYEALEAAFDKYGEEEFLKFERISNPLSRRADLCAMIFLDQAVPTPVIGQDIIADTQYEEVYFGIDPEELATKITEDDVKMLVRCGIRLDDGGLCMFT